MVSIGSIWIATASPMTLPSRLRTLPGGSSRGSVQPRLELLQQRGGAVTIRPAVAPQSLLEGGDRRAVIAELRAEQTGLVPERGVIGGEQQHALDDGQRLVELLALHQAQLDVVLQPQQHLTIA